MNIYCPENVDSVEINITEEETTQVTQPRWSINIDFRYLLVFVCVSVLVFVIFFIYPSTSTTANITTITIPKTQPANSTIATPTTVTSIEYETPIDVDRIIHHI